MPTISKQALFEEGVAIARAIIKDNRLTAVPIRDAPRLRSTGLYTHYSGYDDLYPKRALIQVNVAYTAWQVTNPTVRRQSRPGWKTDRTAKGVVLHELGHHVWYSRADKCHAAWRKVIRQSHPSARVSGYEPCVEESFAESFRLYALNPSLLKAALPARYHCIRDVFKITPPTRQRWATILPPEFHGRAKAWIAAQQKVAQ